MRATPSRCRRGRQHIKWVVFSINDWRVGCVDWACPLPCGFSVIVTLQTEKARRRHNFVKLLCGMPAAIFERCDKVPEFYRQQAEAMRARASGVSAPTIKKEFSKLDHEYDVLADRLEHCGSNRDKWQYDN
jgi:hypothetical protein